jgi:hypothetical protein
MRFGPPPVAALLAALLAGCGGAAPGTAPSAPPALLPAAGTQVRVLARGAESAGDAALGDAALACLRSCRDRERRLVAEPDWAAARAAPLAVLVRWPEPATIDAGLIKRLEVTEVLVPFDLDGREGQALARDGETLYSAFSRADAGRLAVLRAAAAASLGTR